jgi:type II secretory pathway component PulJ
MKARGASGRLDGEGGFTLAELLVVCVLMVLVVAAIGSMIQSGVENSSANYGLVRVEEAGNEALSVMCRQIRSAVSLSPDCTSNELIFAANLNGDVDLDGNEVNEWIQFRAENGFLQKGSIVFASGPPTMQDWIEGCDQLTFTYWAYDETTKGIKQISPGTAEWTAGGVLKIMRIDFELHFTKGGIGDMNVQRTFTGSASIRNNLVDLF